MKENLSKQNVVTFSLTYLLSTFGYEFIFFIMTVHVYDLTQNALNVSIFTVLTFIPKFFAPFYGAIADRYQRQWVLGGTALVTAGLMFCLSLTRAVELIYLLWFLISVALTLIANVRGSLFAEVLPTQNYQTGNSIMLILSNSARLLAPLLGGAATLLVQREFLFYGVALIYITAAVLSMFIKPISRLEPAARASTPGDWSAGFQYIKNNKAIKYLVAVGFLWRLFLGLQVSLWIIYIKSFLNGNDAQYGYFMTLIGLGSVLGSLLGAWASKKFRLKRMIILGLSLHYATFAALGLINQFAAACLVVFISFMVFYATLVSMHTLRDRATQSAIRGRVYGAVTALITPPAIVSMLVGGYLVEMVGVNWIFLLSGGLAVASLVGISLAKSFSTNGAFFQNLSVGEGVNDKIV